MDWTRLFEALMERVRPAEFAAGLIINAILTLLIVVVGLALARSAKRRVVALLAATKASGNLAVLLGNAAFIGTVLLAILATLSLYGLDASALVTVLSVSTVAIGLALQDMLKNLCAGIYLLLEQPFKIGDTIMVDSREGEVESIEVRTTVLRLPDGTQALVPNAMVLATTVMNRTAYPTRRSSIKIVDLTEDFEVIHRRVTAALAHLPGLASSPGPQVHVATIQDGKYTVTVDVWRPADRDLPPEVMVALRTAFPEASVSPA